MSEDKMREELKDKFVEKCLRQQAGNSGLDIGDVLDGDGNDAFIGFQFGYDEGVKACAAIKDAEIAEITKRKDDYFIEMCEVVDKNEKLLEEIAARDLMIKELREALIKANDPYSNLGTCITDALAKSEHHNSRALEKMLLEASINELTFTRNAILSAIARRDEMLVEKLAELNKE